MRLIDADKLCLPPEDIGSRMAVAYAPTAYNVEKVIEEIEMCEHVSLEGFPMIDMNDAIDIVKRGGISED